MFAASPWPGIANWSWSGWKGYLDRDTILTWRTMSPRRPGAPGPRSFLPVADQHGGEDFAYYLQRCGDASSLWA